MQRNSLVGFGLATLTSLASLAISVNPVFSQTKTSQTENSRVTFTCQKIFDPASDKRIPATLAWIPQRKEHIRFIAWKSEFLPSWSPEKRCKAATKKFQEFYDKGTLNYLSHGTYRGYQVICAVQKGEKCSGKNKIFRIKTGSKPEIVLQRLLNIAEGTTSQMLYQNSGKQLFIDVNQLFNKADAVDIPNNATAYNNQGNVNEEQTKSDLALADYSKAIQVNPNDAVAYKNRGNLYRDQKKFDLALADYNKAIQINPKYAIAYIERGYAFYLQKKHDLALADYNKSIQINPKYGTPYLGRAIIWTEQKKWDLALDDYNKIIAIQPKFAGAYKFRGVVYLQKNDKQKAIENFQQAAKLFKEQGDTKNHKLVIDMLQEVQK